MPQDTDQELQKRLEKAVARLPRSTREIFLAHRLDELSYQQIAERTGLSVREVERHMAKALCRISKALDCEPPRWWEWLLGR